MKRALLLLTVILLVLGVVAPAALADSTAVPGHMPRYDQDDNGYPDAGIYVNGHYTSLFAYECVTPCTWFGGYPNQGWYWDLGDGRIDGTVGGVDELDQDTLTVCDYEVSYRADFGNTSFMDHGWIINSINCSGYDDNSHYMYLIVSDTDPRFTGNGIDVGWGPTWQAVVFTISGLGNLAKPYGHVG